jgi:hypothetical protein
MSYAKQGASGVDLGKLYTTLLPSCPVREKSIDHQIMALVAGKQESLVSITTDVEVWIKSTNGTEFSVGQIYGDLCLASKEGKDTARQALCALVRSGVIERIGKRTGIYRRIVKEWNEQTWWEKQDQRMAPFRLPLGLEDKVRLIKGCVVLVEGVKSAGKTTLCFEICRLNRHFYLPDRIKYLNIEMSDGEIAEKVSCYPPDIWSRQQVIESVEFGFVKESWWDHIEPDRLTVVDYVRDNIEAYRVADYIDRIHAKLKDGICVVCVQRDPKKDYGQGGSNIRSIPRLILSMQKGRIKIEDTKYFWRPTGTEPNPSGLTRKFKLVDGWKFLTNGDWRTEEEDKYGEVTRPKKSRDFVPEEDET